MATELQVDQDTTLSNLYSAYVAVVDLETLFKYVCIVRKNWMLITWGFMIY